ncbi:MAG TPA: hypothetical protein VKY35_04415 [Aliidiomarina sp.]|nr:hypothetical protein [Aliidiomarina sp.]
MTFIIVVAIVVIAVLVYRKAQMTKARDSHSEATKAVEPAVQEKPAEKMAPKKEAASVKPASDDSEEKVVKPAAVPKAKVVAKEEHPQVSPNLPDTLAEAANALSAEKDPLTRHRWLSQITETTYKKRKDAQYRAACDYFSALHMNEFDKIKAPLKKSNGGKLPQVMTFQNYANLLLEDERFDEAVEVCRKAIKFGLDDKTQTGFEGRIERIQAKQKKTN